ncbi:MAG TPA: GNAT family N-acetyltransferase [Desulfuromonadaceae bacterium]
MAEAWELDFVLSTFSCGCFSARDATGTAIGFITSYKHHRSGWIGNLIVSREWRGKGLGEILFLAAYSALKQAGVETAWLTASKMGQSLYEKHGFRRIDTINRWTGAGEGKIASCAVSKTGFNIDIDLLGWGDRRERLLAVVTERGRCLAREGCFAVLQPCGEAVQLGPFATVDPARVEVLLQDVLDHVPKGCPIYIDAPASNQAVFVLLQKRKFQIQGSNELMYAGIRPDYRPSYIYGLASMGSMG